MAKRMFFFFKKLCVAATAVLCLWSAAGVNAQETAVDPEETAAKNEEAIALISSAMDAYSNLEMQKAKALLDQALAMKSAVDAQTLSKIFVNFGVVWIGGFSDNVHAQEAFIAALCRDPEAKVDPLFSTPDIEMVYGSAQNTATPDYCADKGLTGVAEAQNSGLVPCGAHIPLVEQKKSYELPFYIEISQEMRSQVKTMVVHYAFDMETEFREYDLPPHGAGYGAILSCGEGGILAENPSKVSYYIVGLDVNGEVACGNGDEGVPLEVDMSDDVPPLPTTGGLIAKECIRCEPGDMECEARKRGRGIGDPCTSDADCIEGFTCSDARFVCEDPKAAAKAADAKKGGPKRFYVGLMGGTGFGYMSKDITIRKADFGDDNNLGAPDPRKVAYEAGKLENPLAYEPPNGNGVGAIMIEDQTTKGTSWSGIPLRLLVGFHVTPKLSIELSGRVDVFIVRTVEPLSCWEAAGADLEKLQTFGMTACNLDFATDDSIFLYSDEDQKTLGKYSVALDPETQQTRTKTKSQVAWLLNARIRYHMVNKGGFKASLFGGIGYGHIQYRVPSLEGDDSYYPLPGMVNIELGPGIAYFFNRNFGLMMDIPIDFIVGDGLAINFDFNLGIGVGF